MPCWRSLLLIAAMSATISSLVLAGFRHFRPFQFGRLEYACNETWVPSPPRLILFPDGKVDMTVVDDHDRTVLIHPTRSELTDDEASRLRALIAAVDWNRIRPRYDAEVENGEESACRISVGDRLCETSVDAVGESREPEELTALFHFLEDLSLVLSPPGAADGAASDPDDELEHFDISPPAYSDDQLPVPETPDFPRVNSSPRIDYGPFKELVFECSSSWGGNIPSLTLLPRGECKLGGLRAKRSQLTDDELSRLKALIASVDWTNLRPYYQPTHLIMDGGACSVRISFAQQTFGTSVYCPELGAGPYAVRELFGFLGQISSRLAASNRQKIGLEIVPRR